jgi:cell division septation protein DedD
MAFDPENYLINLEKNPNKTPRFYLPVQWRIFWLRQDHPNAQINTEAVVRGEEEVWFKATVKVPDEIDGSTGVMLTQGGSATGWAKQTPADFAGNSNWIEKCETKSLGRALGALGYGTQFTDDFDEDDSALSDAPVAKPAESKPPQSRQEPAQQPRSAPAAQTPTTATAKPSQPKPAASSQPSGQDPTIPINGGATESQLKALYALGEKTQAWSVPDVADWCEVMFNAIPENLTREEAGKAIIRLQQGPPWE